ncbi:alpha/beta hydrolase family protein [Brevundimonas sp. Root1279]|uniref:alpha/beta hydrolase family protein n=1 Tax=Brevundimonas sp. Root1279 TaxID=1736443 RepID=UPI0006FA88F7|nr:S9 family peptidase [Brevundimonas sp. Root1279]KQW86495.1 prolyl oligopeptidase [Brevundimonas sp. Root1279]
MPIRMSLLAGATALALCLPGVSALAQTAPEAPDPRPTAAGGLSPQQLAMMERVSDPRLSPDGRRVLYNVRTTDWAGNKGVGAAWVVEADGATRRLPASDGGVGSARWSPDGTAIYFLSTRGGSSQVWRMDAQGQAATQVTSLPVDVTAFRLAADGRTLIVALPVFLDCAADLACSRDRLKANAAATVRTYDRQMLRPWDSWNDGRRSHLFALDLNGSGLAAGQPRDLMAGMDGDAPSRPLGDDGEFNLSPDGTRLAFQTQTQGRAEAYTNNTDVFVVPVAGGPAVNVTQGNAAPDFNPVFSPDGRRLAWLAGRRENVFGDQPVLMIADADGSDARAVAADWDRGAGGLRWRPDGRALYALAAEDGQQKLFEIDARSGAVRAVTGRGTAAGFDAVGDRLVVAHETFDGPAQLVEIGRDGPQPLTRHNAEATAGLDLPKGEHFTFSGWNGEPVQGWVFKPAGYVEGRTYPVLYVIHGGPKSPFSDGWSYRWNPQIYTGAGFGVVMVNFHGTPGFGQAFTDSINEHWGDRPLEDLQKGWTAALAANPWMDGERACALGASYGGYMVNLIAGKWNAPWDCLVNHAGVFDVGQLMNAMDIANFGTSEFSGASWEHPELYRQFSPNTYVADWSKPMLVLHGSRDFRVPIEQGLGTFSALQRQGIESRFVHVPDENHWVLKPRTWVDWQQEILDWTTRHTAAQ